MVGTPLRLLVAVAMVCLLVGGLGGSAQPVSAQSTLSELGTHLVETQTGRAFRVGASALVAWSPDGKLAAVSDNAAVAGPSPLRLVTVPDGTAQPVTLPDRSGVDAMRWAPDGSRLAISRSTFGGRTGPVLGIVDAATGVYRELSVQIIGGLAWTPDSAGLTVISMNGVVGSVVTVNAATGSIQETISEIKDATCQVGMSWSPDGRFLAYGGPGLREPCGDVGNWGIWTWEPATRTTRQLFQGAAGEPAWLANGEIVAMVSEPQPEGVPPLSILRFSPTGGAPRPIVRDLPRTFPPPARPMQVVGNNVLYVISTCEVAEAYLWAPERTAPARETPPDAYAYRATLAPDGLSLAFVRVGQRSELEVVAVGGGEARVPLASSLGLDVGIGARQPWSPDGRWLAIEVTSEQFRDCVG